MNAIRNYLDNMFRNLPNTEEVRRAKTELLEMMEDKYEELIKEGKTENEIVANICQTFNVNPDEVEKDLCQFLKDMVDKQLIDIYQPEE